MAVRLLHVPTIVSLRQLELDSIASAGGGAWSSHPTPSENTPIASAPGASLPLYMYPAGGTMAKAPRGPSANEVPDFFQPGTGYAWDLAMDQHLSGQEDKTGRILGKNCTQNDDNDMRDDDQSQTDNNNLLAMVVPVCTTHQTSAAKPIPSASSPWSSQFISDLPEGSDALGRSLTAFDDNDMLSESSSLNPSMQSSPRPSSNGSKRGVVAVRSTLDTLITALWDDCDARGLFRYNVSQCATRVVPSKLGWVAQLNEGRMSKKRPTELKVDAVLQPFDNNKFNFGRAFLKEVLLEFEPLPSAGEGAGLAMQRAWAASNTGAQVIESYGMPSDPTLVMINVSPIDYGHVLLVPHVLDQRPQQLDVEGVSAALAFTREVANPTFRLGYNSLGAYATINHLHFQGYYLSQRLPCEKASTQPLRGFDHPAVLVSQLTDYPVRGWVVEVRHGLDPLACEGDLAAVIMQICGQLQSMDQPFNVMLVDQGTRVFIWPQCYAERQAKGEVAEELLETGVNPAVFEVAGHLVLKRAEDYENASDAWACRLLAGVSLTQDRFEQLTRLCLGCECGPVMSRRGSLGGGCGREAMNCGLAWELETAFQWCTDR